MDMSAKQTWLYQPVTLDGGRAFTCDGFETAEQCSYYQHRWHFWYIADWVFALPTVAFFMCSIGIFIIGRFTRQAVDFRGRRTTSAWRRLIAGTRYLSYRGFRIESLRWNSAPLGVLLLGAVGTIFFICMDLVPQPYYWPGSDSLWGNSPPLATRSGWMALACMPFVFATASKANWITLLTGVSHEKLQVFHRWTAYAFLVLALMHTFPFIVWHIRNQDMVQQFNVDNYFTYWTGVVALILQAWLTIASFSWFRNICYEFFKLAHFASVILFVLFFFWHCGGTLTSWDYFVATAAVYVPSLVYPWLRTLFEYGVKQTAQLEVEYDDLVKISISSNFHWVPGQHCFLRFLGFGSHVLTSHPFTICSLPSISPEDHSTAVFYVRACGGFTRRLYERAKKEPGASMPVLVDGPYGGIERSKYYNSDRLLVIAGGSGSGWALPFIEEYVRSNVASPRTEETYEDKIPVEGCCNDSEANKNKYLRGPSSLRVVLATRDTATRLWARKSISDLLGRYDMTNESGSFEVEIHLTGEAQKRPDEHKLLADLGKSASSSSVSNSNEITADKNDFDLKEGSACHVASQEFNGRPALPSVVHEEAIKASESSQSLGVFVCGPESMQNDVRNAVAARNLDCFRSSSPGSGIYLHVEHFSWA